jgi:hypothetical protein
MMLTSSLFMPPQQQYYSPYTPPRSSPLSERSSNVAPRLFDFGMTSHSNNMKSPTPQRAFKPNPVIQTRDAATKRRRDMFFKRVQNGREDKKWESRGEQVSETKRSSHHPETNPDQIQQLDFVSERKRWEAEKARQAPPEEDEMVEEDAPLPEWTMNTPQPTQEMTEADYVAAQEEFELQQLIASMEQKTTPRHNILAAMTKTTISCSWSARHQPTSNINSNPNTRAMASMIWTWI